MNQKERLLKVLARKEVDRPPVICPGGMMNAAVSEIVTDLEKNHNADKKTMVQIAKKVYELTGFENYGVPFCMTVECEPCGVKVNLGNKNIEPRVTEYNKNQIEDIMKKKINPKQEKRMSVVLEAINKLKNDNIPVIGNLTGHISTATSIIDPLQSFKMLHKNPEKIYNFFKYVNNYLIDYALEMVKAGADVIAISDPSATGEILGAKNFEKFAVPFYKKIVEKLHEVDVPVIIHICGNTKVIIDSLNLIDTNALSFDSVVNIEFAKSRLKTNVMGNVNTQLLHRGRKDKIIAATKNCINKGVDIVAPACGLSMATQIDKLKIMTDFVREGAYR
ncbi:[methyl-Co(III) methanol-specific corrinoid protein]:coenzyme M methyltransferase [Halanaerobium saccharolyticum]|uniref:[methyl-Co(III) methanol-specific corrinoid protein]:coenzyme M methyltransferase n=1 Tax=Halanaerobium saccharolyticum TaxID=43595 RepID=A0A4R6LV85_9FIRM|nr:uroporphyrinogen decarboxylase family protein [Halanaerobium saccharolyticum]TDO90117.1 [methyl-Co(III) methanol-specific corrinoid protein]:coenzyme M methyltransferase [Halanaerobium saccharolyticum]